MLWRRSKISLIIDLLITKFPYMKSIWMMPNATPIAPDVFFKSKSWSKMNQVMNTKDKFIGSTKRMLANVDGMEIRPILTWVSPFKYDIDKNKRSPFNILLAPIVLNSKNNTFFRQLISLYWSKTTHNIENYQKFLWEKVNSVIFVNYYESNFLFMREMFDGQIWIYSQKYCKKLFWSFNFKSLRDFLFNFYHKIHSRYPNIPSTRWRKRARPRVFGYLRLIRPITPTAENIRHVTNSWSIMIITTVPLFSHFFTPHLF